jgi:uncharacterized protein
MPLHVLALDVELHLPVSQSLKAKRSVVTSVLDTCRRRFEVAATEAEHQDAWQRTRLGFAAVSGEVARCTDVIDRVERYIWSVPDVEVLSAFRHWMDVEH